MMGGSELVVPASADPTTGSDGGGVVDLEATVSGPFGGGGGGGGGGGSGTLEE